MPLDSRLLLFALISCSNSLGAGDISGFVQARGKDDTGGGAGAGQYASRKYKFVERVDYDALRDFVVYLDGPTNSAATPVKRTAKVTTVPKVAQRGARFSPHVLPVVKGTTVEWPNNDDIYHNVFSMSAPCPFDLGLYKSGEQKEVTFDNAGRVDVFCSIHTSMSCIVLVLDNPYFAVVDANGHYTIPDVPAGTYTITAWHERMPTQSRQITVPEEGSVKADFEMGITGLPQL